MDAGWTAGDTLPHRDPEATASPSSTGDVRWRLRRWGELLAYLHLSRPSTIRWLPWTMPISHRGCGVGIVPRGERTHRVVRNCVLQLVSLKLMVTTFDRDCTQCSGRVTVGRNGGTAALGGLRTVAPRTAASLGPFRALPLPGQAQRAERQRQPCKEDPVLNTHAAATAQKNPNAAQRMPIVSTPPTAVPSPLSRRG